MATIALAILVMAGFAAVFPSSAAATGQVWDCGPWVGMDWLESGAESFTILYPRDYAAIGQRLAAPEQKAALDDEYARLEALFGVSLNLPVTIRVYPNAQTYACLNAGAEQLPDGALHTHSGGREIGLIGDRIMANYPYWSRSDFNPIRYELGALFLRQIAGDAAPDGLLTALGSYLQDPEQTIGMLQLHWSDWQTPSYSWRELWEESPPAGDLSRRLQSTATVAFLIDAYGWERFADFLERLSNTPGFTQALSDTYQVDLTDLETRWREYYPRYFQGGWRSHLLYNYNLLPYEDLLTREEYAEADRQLLEAIDFLIRVRDQPKLTEAQFMLLRARKGQEAEALFGQSQQAYQAGEFERALELIDQAEARYAEAGARILHLDELAAHRGKVDQAQALRVELDVLRSQSAGHWNTFLLANQMLVLGRRFVGLGDADGYNQVRQIAQVVEARQRGQYTIFALIILVVILGLLILLARLARRAPPPEAQL